MNIHKIILKIISISVSILVTLLVIIGLIRLGEYCYHFGYRVFTEPAVEEEPGSDVVVLLTEDMSEYDIGGALQEKGLIRDKNLFFAQLKLSAYAGKLRSGTYTLNTSMTARDMMAVMAAETVESTEETEEAGSSGAAGPTQGDEAPGETGSSEATESAQGDEAPEENGVQGAADDDAAGDAQGEDTPEAAGDQT